jgi:hypothetical protein
MIGGLTTVKNIILMVCALVQILRDKELRDALNSIDVHVYVNIGNPESEA